jgi:hypothetical protein
MTKRLAPVTPEVRARLAELANREIPLEEWRAQLAVPLSPEEIENTRELVRWFCQRYPTPAGRLAYVRKAYQRWSRNLGASQG